MKRRPAHQNERAFKHNTNSKLTKKIAEEPLDFLCRNCFSILEWKKKYRKYKMRTVPGRCNICREKAVLKGHRKICDRCGEDRNICTKCEGPVDLIQEEEEEIKTVLED